MSNTTEKIKNLVVESKSNIADILRLCLILWSELKSSELTIWAKSELNWYSDESTVPDYRILWVQWIKWHFFWAFNREIKNWDIPFSAIPERYRDNYKQIRLGEPIATYTSLLEWDSTSLHVPIEINISVHWFSNIYEWMQCVQSWCILWTSQFEGFIDQIKTRILEFILNLEDEINSDENFIKDKTEVRNIFITNIYGWSIGNIWLNNWELVNVKHWDLESLKDQLKAWWIEDLGDLEVAIKEDGWKNIGSAINKWLEYVKPITQWVTADMVTKAILMYLWVS